MTFWDWIRATFNPYKQPAAPQPSPLRATPAPAERPIPTGRVSVDMPGTVLSDAWIMVPPADYESNWRTLNLDAAHLDELPPHDLLDMLVDLSPEISRAYWDLLRLCNPGWECKAFRTGSEDAEDARAQAALDVFFDTLRDQYGAVDVVIGRLFGGAFLRGAFCSELVLDASGREMLDLATPDPYSVRFRKRRDELRGEVWQPGQWQGGEFVPLDIPTFRYLPIDPAPGVPYGKPLAAPALFTSIFLLGLMHDVKRVIMQQGYRRMDISIVTEQAIASYQQSNAGYATFDEYVAAAVQAVKTAYAALEPDDAFIHSDMIVINDPAGTISSDSIGAIDQIIEKLERMAARALKTNSLMMGNDESASETDSNRRWEIHVAGVKSLQHYCENMLESLLTLGLEAQGIQARVEFRFAELRAAEELRDAQVAQLKIANATAKRDQGWVSQDEASNEVTGHDAEEDAPVQQPTESPQQGGDNDGQEALNQDSDSRKQAIGQRVKLTPDGADEPLVPVPDEVAISDSDVDRALAEWDELMPDYAGLLDADVQGQTDFDADRAIATRANGSPWLFDNASHRYRNTTTGQYVGQKQMTELRDQFAAAKREGAQALASDLSTGRKSVQEFEVAFRREIKNTFIDQYVLGKGGRGNMTQADWGAVGRMVRDQYMYANDFARDIAGGTLSQAQIAQRAGLYFESSTQAFEQGRSAGYGVPTLPQYPADGRTQCRSNCKCSWQIKDADDSWECTWKLNASAETCEGCLANASRWAPLVILKAGRGRDDLERILEGVALNGHR